MRLFSIFRVLVCRESGAALLETVVALAVLGLIAVTFLNGLITTSEAAFTTDERATAEGLAQSQMEWAQSANYTDNATGYLPAPIPSGSDYTNYSANITAMSLQDLDDGIPGNGIPDNGIQKITVTIEHSGEEIITLEGYKVDR
ncbi:hypothetical protein ACFLUU_03195 [Chloroflexota bacterium]